MNESNLLERKLCQLGEHLRREPSVASAVVASIRESDSAAEKRESLLAEIAQSNDNATIKTRVPATRGREQTRLVRRAVGIAACAIVALGVSWSFMASRSSVAFAQVIEAIQKATTAHCVVQEEKDGQWIETLDFWYSHSNGISERRRNEIGQQLRIDDGSHLWTYQEGTDQAIVAQSVGAKGMIDTLLKPLNLELKFSRDSARDRDIEGTRCRYHRASIGGDELYEAWIDKEDRLHLFIASQKVDENWKEGVRCTVSYDLPVDAARFQPTFGDNVRVVDLSAGFGSLFPLDTAIYRTTEHGLDVGLHELRSVSPTAFLAIVSFRPTQETRRQTQLELGYKYGHYHSDISDDLHKRGVSQKSLHLANFEADGISVHAFLVDHSSFGKPFVPDEAIFTMGIMPYHMMKLPESPSVHFKIPLPANEDASDAASATRLEKAIEELYAKAVIVERLPVDTIALSLAPRAPTERELEERAALQRESVEALRARNYTMIPLVKPSETTLEIFLRDIKSRLQD